MSRSAICLDIAFVSRLAAPIGDIVSGMKNKKDRTEKSRQIWAWLGLGMGPELELSGTLIYDGLRSLDQAARISDERSIFYFFYYISIGIERLLKVAVVFSESEGEMPPDNLDKSLITHNVSELYRRCVDTKMAMKLEPHSNAFLAQLTEFYKSGRYARFGYDGAYSHDASARRLIDYLQERKVLVSFDGESFYNSDQIRKFIGERVYRVVRPVYERINNACSSRGVYSDEFVTRSDKASFVFLSECERSINFIEDRAIRKDVLLYLMAYGATNASVSGVLRVLQPLNLPPDLVPALIDSILNYNEHRSLINWAEELYAEMPSSERESRRAVLDALGDARYNVEQEEIDRSAKFFEVVDGDDEIPF